MTAPDTTKTFTAPVTIETFEPQRWEQKEVDPRITDEHGNYIVSNGKWHTGEMAYATPPPPAPTEARFGYNIVQIKKPQTYWNFYRTTPHFSFAHLNYMVAFACGLIWLLAFLTNEINSYYYHMMKPGNLVGTQRGKGAPTGKNVQVKVTDAEDSDTRLKMSKSYFNADELDYKGNKDYQMKKIARPKELRIQDYMRV